MEWQSVELCWNVFKLGFVKKETGLAIHARMSQNFNGSRLRILIIDEGL